MSACLGSLGGCYVKTWVTGFRGSDCNLEGLLESRFATCAGIVILAYTANRGY